MSRKLWRASTGSWTTALSALVTLAMLGSSSSAAAHALTFHAPLPSGGPALARGAPVWAEGRPDHRIRIRRRDPDSHAIRTVLTGPPNEQDQLARIVGSDSTLAVEIISGGSGSCTDNFFCLRDIYAGPAAGDPLPLQSNCQAEGGTEVPAGLDVKGSRVIYANCPFGPPQIENVRTGASTRTEGGWRGLRIAGRYIAWVSGNYYSNNNAITVYDWKRKAAVYILQPPVMDGIVGDLDLAPDGTVVWPIGAPHQESQLGWASPDSPRVHRIAVPPRDRYQLKLVAGKIVFEGGTEDDIVPRADLGVTDLAGHSKILATGAFEGSGERQFDFDGKRVAWYAFSCSGVRMHVQSLDSKVIHESMTRCPLRFKRAPRIRQGRVELFLNCYGYTYSCEGREVVLKLKARPHTVVGRGATADHITLTDQGRKLLQERGKLHVRATLTMTDLSGTHEHRSGLVTLSRP